MKVKSENEVAQLCLTRSDPMDCSLRGSSVHGIFQARVLLGSNSFQFIIGELMLFFIIPLPNLEKRNFGNLQLGGTNLFPGFNSSKSGSRVFQVTLQVKNPPANAGDPIHPSILAWKIPRTEEPGGLQSMGSQRTGHD